MDSPKHFPPSTFFDFFLTLLLVSTSFRLINSDINQDKQKCTNALIGLSTCLPYVTINSTAKAPTLDCCGGLKQVVNTKFECLCILVKYKDDPSLGLKINATLVLGLPVTCQVPANISRCIDLLHLTPSSKDAKVFEDYTNIYKGINNTTAAAPTDGVDASGTFNFVNNCPYTVWPGIFSNTGITPISTTGFALPPESSNVIQAPSGWGGQFWARTHCSNNSTGKFTCLTGDCGSGKIECDGGTAALPVTLAEFTMDGSQGMDFYDVSVISGYNLPLLVVPQAGSRDKCSTTGCVADLNSACPVQLKVTAEGGEGVACKSACATPCAGASSLYLKAVKSACPRAYTDVQDDYSTFTCAGANYTIEFCPSPATSQNLLPDGNNNSKGNENDNNFMPSSKNGTMIYHGETDFVNSRAVSLSSTTSTWTHVLRFAETVAVAITVMRLYYNSPFRFM